MVLIDRNWLQPDFLTSMDLMRANVEKTVRDAFVDLVANLMSIAEEWNKWIRFIFVGCRASNSTSFLQNHYTNTQLCDCLVHESNEWVGPHFFLTQTFCRKLVENYIQSFQYFQHREMRQIILFAHGMVTHTHTYPCRAAKQKENCQWIGSAANMCGIYTYARMEWKEPSLFNYRKVVEIFKWDKNTQKHTTRRSRGTVEKWNWKILCWQLWNIWIVHVRACVCAQLWRGCSC